MPLYHIDQTKFVLKIKSSEFPEDGDLQKLFEANPEGLLGIRFVVSECTHKGRIETMGTSQKDYPKIIEKKLTWQFSGFFVQTLIPS